MHLSESKIKELEIKANDIRQTLVEMLVEAGSGHTAGPLGMADIFTALYFHILRHDPKQPGWAMRDRLVLSNGHICPVLYSTLYHAGYLTEEDTHTLRKLGTKLQGHPHREYLPMLETSSGPLGAGLSQAAGMALAARMYYGNQPTFWIYALLSDGELDEGNSWEAVMLASKYRLDNLIAIVDRNNVQIEGNTEDVMPLESLSAKWAAFGWHVLEIDGHNFESIVGAVEEAKARRNRPTVIIAHTIPGKGVKEFERDYHWHGKSPNREQADMALKELRTLGGKIRSEHE